MKVVSKVVGFVALSLVLMMQTELRAQSSLVPSYHPVYEWLYQYRVQGNLPYYDYESLPLTRGRIVEHLNELKQQGLAGKQAQTLDSFLNEFDPEVLAKQTLEEPQSLLSSEFKTTWSRAKEWIWSDREKHIYAWSGEPGYMVIDHGFGRRSMFVEDEGESRNAPYILNQHWRSYGSLIQGLGYHIDYMRAVPVGDKWIFDYDGFYSYNWKYRLGANPNNYHYEGYISYSTGLLEASIGRGNLKEGIGRTDNLIFSRSSIPIDWFRLKVGKERLRYMMIHGRLTWRSRISTLETDGTIETKNSPDRWVAYHKLTIQPWSFLSFSGYEMINYSNRGAELAYLNPVNRYAFGEWELQDQDNGWFGVHMLVRPFKGVEFSTELTMDDLGEKKDIFSKKIYPATSRFGRRYNAQWSIPNSSNYPVVLWAEYTRLDPFLYSHPYDLNAHADKGIALGSQIGPNADRLELGAQLWGKGRSYLRWSYSQNRQGLNEYDEDGNLSFLSGSSPNDGRDELANKTYLFLDGDLHEWDRNHIELAWEFKRAYILEINLDIRTMKKGEQLSDRRIFWADLVIGL